MFHAEFIKLNRRLILAAALLLTFLLGSATLTTAAPQAQAAGTLSVTSPISGGFTYSEAFHNIAVVDADMNTTPGPGNNTVQVEVYHAACGVGAPVTVLVVNEHPTTSGRFVLNGYQNNAPVNGPLCFRYVDANPVANRNVSFNVIGTSATISVSPANATPGTTLTVTVVDADRNLHNGNSNDTLSITAQNFTGGGPLIPLILNESGAGTFQGTLTNIDAIFAGNVPQVGHFIHFTYADTFRALGAPATITALHEVTGTDGTVTVTPSPASRGATLRIVVRDIDDNITPGGSNDTITGRLGIDTNNGAFTIGADLVETATAGVFEAYVQLAAFADPANTPLLTTDFPAVGPVVVRYVDEGTSAGGGTVNRLVNVNIVGVNGVLTLSSSVMGINGNIDITLNDLDENLEISPIPPNPADTVGVTITRLLDSTSLPVTLTESSTQAGYFTLNFTYADLIAAWPAAAAGELFQVRYPDTPNTGGATIINRDVNFQLVAGADVLRFEVTPSVVEIDSNVDVLLCDSDLNMTAGGGNDTATVFLRNPARGTTEYPISLAETTEAGCFTNVFNVGRPGLESRYEEQVRVRYADVPSGGGVPVDVVRTVNIRHIGTEAGLTVTDTIPGRPIYITLNDFDLDSSITTVEIKGHNLTQNHATMEKIILRYAGTKGRYIGWINTAYQSTDDLVVDGVINVTGGDVVRFFYDDLINVTGFARVLTADANVRSRIATSQVCNQHTTTTAPAWKAEYFNNRALEGNPTFTVTEPFLSINWEETAPFRDFPADSWSARFSTTIEATQTGKFRFRAGVDDGIRLFLNDVLILDQFAAGPFRQFTADATLRQGPNRVVVEYFDDAYSAGIILDCVYLEGSVLAIDPESGGEIEVYPSDVFFDEAVAHMTTGRINVRANPTITAQQIDMVYIYGRYPIEGITEDGDWYLIRLKDGRTGWVAARYVRRYESNPVQIYPNWAGSEAALPNVEVTGYATAELKIRVAPRNGAELAILPAGASFRVLSRTQNSAWYRIEFEGVNGWVYAPYVDLTNGTVNDLMKE